MLEGLPKLVEREAEVAKGLMVERVLPGGRMNGGKAVAKILAVEEGRSVDGEVVARYGMVSRDVDNIGRWSPVAD